MRRYVLALFSILAILQLGNQLSAGENQILKTQLIVTVLDDLGNVISDAKVTLYATEEDYNKMTNPATETLSTNDKGKVRFVGLEPQPYYIVAENSEKDNFLRGEKTEALDKGRFNKVNVIID